MIPSCLWSWIYNCSDGLALLCSSHVLVAYRSAIETRRSARLHVYVWLTTVKAGRLESVYGVCFEDTCLKLNAVHWYYEMIGVPPSFFTQCKLFDIWEEGIVVNQNFVFEFARYRIICGYGVLATGLLTWYLHDCIVVEPTPRLLRELWLTMWRSTSMKSITTGRPSARIPWRGGMACPKCDSTMNGHCTMASIWQCRDIISAVAKRRKTTPNHQFDFEQIFVFQWSTVWFISSWLVTSIVYIYKLLANLFYFVTLIKRLPWTRTSPSYQFI